jgi:hypothetical protein
MDLGFLDNIWQGVGNFGADADQFMKREMPFDSGWGAPAAAVAAYFGGPLAWEAMGEAGAGASGGGMLDSIGGAGGTFGGDAFQLGGSGVGDVFSGWSPTGSSASGMGSGLGTSSSNPLAYNDPYAAQDVMQQARDSSTWDTGSSTKSGLDKSTFQQMLGKQLMQGGLGNSMSQRGNYQYQEQPVQRQPAFAPTPAPFQVQDKQSDLAALIAALRNKGTM